MGCEADKVLQSYQESGASGSKGGGILIVKLGSLFDGISGFPLAASRHGITPVWASEIEAFPIAVSQHHFPDMVQLGDICGIDGGKAEPVDIITFGSPCQDLSVAGKQAGLDGAKSGLFFEAIRIIREMRGATNGRYPRALVWENVPGALSSSDGQDIVTALDAFEELGYVVDLNVIDAQFMGVPQRRRRVFAVCVSLEDLLTQRTSSSVRILTDLVVRLLQDIWEGLHVASPAELSRLGSEDATEQCASSLKKKMSSLGRVLGPEPLRKLLTSWAESQAACAAGASGWGVISDSSKLSPMSAKGIESFPSSETMAKAAIGIESTYTLLNKALDEALRGGKSSTTSMRTSSITQQEIYTFLQATLNITKLIIASIISSESCLSVEQSALTLLQGGMNYARQSSGTLFTELEWAARWDDYLSAASDCAEQLERHLGTQCAGQVLLEREGEGGDIEAGRGEGEEIAADAGGGAETILFQPRSQDGCLRVHRGGIVPTLDTAGGGQRQPCVAFGPGGQHDTANCLRSEPSKAGKPSSTTYVVEPVLAFMAGQSAQARSLGLATDLAPTLKGDAGGNTVPTIAFNARQDPISGTVPGPIDTDGGTQAISYENSGFGKYTEGLGTLRASGGDLGGGSENIVAAGYTVRRLTPKEAERLMGFPDHWTGIPGASDSARYKALGNSVAVPVVSWILGRMAQVLGRE